MLLNENVARISDSAVGCTFAFQKYENPTTGDVLFDTVGLSEGNMICLRYTFMAFTNYDLGCSLKDVI